MTQDDDPVEASHVAEVSLGGAQKKKRRRRSSSHRGAGGRTSVIRIQITDIGMALRELDAARDEIAAVPEHLTRWQRRNVMIEPMSRLQLVRKFIDGVLEQNGCTAELA